MTVSSTTNRKTYAGDDATTSFGTSPVVFFDSGDLTVIVVTDSTGAETTLTENTNYTVSGGSGSTGTVDLSGGSSPHGALLTGTTLVILREMSLVQELDLVNNDLSDAETLEDQLDKTIMLIQQLDEQIGRSILLPPGSAFSDLAIPSPTANYLLGWNSAGTALENKLAADIDLTVITAFVTTLVDDADGDAFFNTVVADMTALSAAPALTDLMAVVDVSLTPDDGRSITVQNLFDAIPAAAGDVWAGYGANTGSRASAFPAPINCQLAYSVAASALTITLKGKDGNDLSATNPALIPFRNATAATGDYTWLALTSNQTLTISNGSTMGFTSASAGRLWVVGFNDGGTFRLAAINCLTYSAGPPEVLNIYPLGAWDIASASAEGGAGGADSAGTFYAGSAITSKAYAVLGYATWESGLSTAGTWDAGPTRAEPLTPWTPLPGRTIQVVDESTGEVATGTTVVPADDTPPLSGEGDEYMDVAITPTSAANALNYEMQVACIASSNTDQAIMAAGFKDAASSAFMSVAAAKNGAANSRTALHASSLQKSGTTSATTFNVRAGTASAGTTTFNGAAASRVHGGVLESTVRITEIIA